MRSTSSSSTACRPSSRSTARSSTTRPTSPRDGSFGVYTSWIETEFDNTIAPYDGEAEVADPAERETSRSRSPASGSRCHFPAGLGPRPAPRQAKKPAKRAATKKAGAAAGGNALTAPMQGTIVKLAVEEGQQVAAGELVVVLEAMKMEQPINAHKAGTISALTAEVGATVTSGAVLCEISD